MRIVFLPGESIKLRLIDSLEMTYGLFWERSEGTYHT
jgi:hypothetical protein